jgi:hypothetical protein
LDRSPAEGPDGRFFATTVAHQQPGIVLWRLTSAPVGPRANIASAQRAAVHILTGLTGWRPVAWLIGAVFLSSVVGLAWNEHRRIRLIGASGSPE